MKDLLVESSIICEDIRQEKSGKYILIGTFPGDINIAQIPGAIVLSLYAELSPNAMGKFNYDFRVADDNSVDLVKGEFSLHINDKSRFAAVIGPVFLKINRAGALKFQWRKQQGMKWEIIKTINVVLNKALTTGGIANASEQFPPDAPAS